MFHNQSLTDTRDDMGITERFSDTKKETDMNNRLMLTTGTLLLATLATADTGPSQEKLNKRLHGIYAVTATAVCQTSDGGYGPPPQLAALGAVHPYTENAASAAVFNGDGTFSSEGNGMAIGLIPAPQPGSPVTYPITKSRFVCDGVYQVNADNTYSVDYTCTGNTASGIVPGLAFTATGYHENGTLKKGKLLSVGIDGNVEHTTTQYGTTSQICSRSSQGVKIDNEEDN
jgi:hypothetical protein